MATRDKNLGFWYPACAGFAGISLGTGLLRFAYTPIVPSLIHADWTTIPQAAWLGSANFWGGLVGMLISLPISRNVPRQHILLAAMVTGTLSLFFCALDMGFLWFAAWRFIQGLTGALIMALLPGGVLANVTAEKRSLAGGLTIAGMGSAFFPCIFFPFINHLGPAAEWLCCGLFGLICLSIAGPFANHHIRGTADKRRLEIDRLHPHVRGPYTLFVVAYAVAGVSMIPDAMYLSDYLVRFLDASPSTASALLTCFAAVL